MKIRPCAGRPLTRAGQDTRLSGGRSQNIFDELALFAPPYRNTSSITANTVAPYRHTVPIMGDTAVTYRDTVTIVGHTVPPYGSTASIMGNTLPSDCRTARGWSDTVQVSATTQLCRPCRDLSRNDTNPHGSSRVLMRGKTPAPALFLYASALCCQEVSENPFRCPVLAATTRACLPH